MLNPDVRRTYALAAICVGVFLSLAVAAFLLWENRRERWASAVQSAHNVLITLTSDINRNLNIVDLSLQGAQDAFLKADLTTLDPATRNMVLFDRALNARYLGVMLILSPSGDVLYDLGHPIPRPGNFSDRDYFLVQKDANHAPYLSRPYNARFRDFEPSVALSRRISGPDGSFRGVVMGGIGLEFFRDLFANVDVGPRGIVSLVRDDGVIVMRWPSSDGHGDTNLDIANSEGMRRVMTGDGQPFTMDGAVDGVRRHYFYDRVGQYPLRLVVAFAVDDVLAPWRRQALAFGAISGASSLLIILLVIALQRALRKERLVSARLENLATTDWLTGLANRRSFDENLIMAGRRAARSGASLSLLMIDADRFKLLNDTFGHAKGDEVLHQIGAVIAAAARRADDVAARYGGEEFAVILPATGAAGAARVAEGIRADIERQVGRPNMPVSVSIGVATGHLLTGRDAEGLLAAADKAVYEAKANGRNRVAVRNLTETPDHRRPPDAGTHAAADYTSEDPRTAQAV